MQLTPETIFLLGLLIFWSIIYITGQIIHADKHGFKIFLFFLSYRSQKFKNVIQALGKKYELLWKTLSTIGSALAFGLTIFATYFLLNNLVKFFSPVVESVPIVPVVPAITIRLDSLPFFFIAVALIVFLHELAHGIIAVSEKIAVKSAGLALMFTFFGGFVEPEEKSFERASRASKLRILAAGSAVNLAVGFIVVLLLSGLFAPSAGVVVNGVAENGPLAVAGVRRFDVITAVNNTEIYSLQNLAEYLANVTPGDVLVFTINDVSVVVISQDLDGRAVVGLLGFDYHPFRLGFDRLVGVNFYLFLDWVFIVAFSVAVFNMLPVYPFDGEKFLYYSVRDYVEEKKRLQLRILINVFFWGLLLANMVLSFLWFGLPNA
ncbi:MAG: site-2 protease family protein [Candidatus Bathyarchaeales archaeon]